MKHLFGLMFRWKTIVLLLLAWWVFHHGERLELERHWHVSKAYIQRHLDGWR